MKKIKHRNHEEVMCVLVDGLGNPVEAGRAVTDQYGDTWIVTGGAAPHNSHSSGHVWVDHSVEPYSRTFYVAVLGMRWVPDTEET